MSDSFKKILIIGSDGYVGSVLLPALKNLNYDVYSQDVSWFVDKRSASAADNHISKKQINKDIRDMTIDDFHGFESVIILSAVSNDPMGKKFETVTYEINRNATIQAVKLAKEAGVRSLVFASSCSVYGIADDSPRKENDLLNPLTAYAKSKVEVEQGISSMADNKFLVTCLRFATAGGASQRLRLDLVLNDFVASAVLNNFIEILSDGSPWRPIIHTEDMARSIIWAIDRIPRSENENFITVNVGSEKWTFTMESLARKVSQALGNIEVIINPEGKPDPRSYKVDFSLFKELAPFHQPTKDFNEAVLELKDLIIENRIPKDFRSSRWIRFNHLNHLIEKNLLDNHLRWIK